VSQKASEAPYHKGLARHALSSRPPADDTILTDSRVSTRAAIDLAAWRRLRRSPAGGDWWGGHAMWTWDQAERSRGRWSA
jgi:hypothetical protein